LKWYADLVLDCLGESLIFAVICAAAGVVGAQLLHYPFQDALGFVMLVVSAGLMLIGGALSFVSPGNVKVFNALMSGVVKEKLNPGPDDYRRSMHRAALYSLTGVLLFSYSLLMAFILG
jgi:hypothetical protein